MPITPYRGDIAICSKGMPGLITSDGPEEVTYPDGNKGLAWTGIHLSEPFGGRWSSRNPKVVANLEELVRRAKVVRSPKCQTCFQESTSAKPLTFIHDVYGIRGYRECTNCSRWDRKVKIGCLIAMVLFTAIIYFV